MTTTRILIMIIIAAVGVGFSGKRTWIIDSQSRLSIQGSSNVNHFTCKIEYCTGTDTLHYVTNNRPSELRFTRSRMTIPIRSFDCGTKQISKDFWATLKSDKYPDLDINFRSLQDLSFKNNSHINGVVDITLAGVTARYNIRYLVTVENRETILLKGIHKVNFSDFKLEAPEKLNGLIKVKEVLKVEFNLVLKEI